MRKIAISQSNYIPWKGYFDMINSVDEFVLFDDMQFTRRDWRNRNKVKTANGTSWLTIPVDVKGKYFQKINETVISDPNWGKTHWATIKQWYSKATYFKAYKDSFEEFYLSTDEKMLSLVNFRLISIVNEILGIKTKLSWSADYELKEERTERLLHITKQAGGQVYVSGPAAKAYMDEDVFGAAGVQVQWMDYANYPEYTQLYPPFEHAVSVLDLIFNEGPQATNYMKTFGRHE